MTRTQLATAVVALCLALQPGTALACGGLVAPNGSVRLARATTLVDWHAGVEHYLTSFAYRGQVSDLGWIVPLPAVPSRIERGGDWTLQRLEREVQPRLEAAVDADHAAGAEVLQQVRVDALDITVLRGSGEAVIRWCAEHHFLLPAETRDHIVRYASASPIFMAARYDVGEARRRGLLGGDGTPLLITIPVAHPWVPLEILANDDDPVGADLFLLSDGPLSTGEENPFPFSSPEGRQLPGAPGFVIRRQEQLSDSLHRDLASDRNMGWVRAGSWLTYLTLDAQPDSVTYDLSVSGDGQLRLASFGSPPRQVAEGARPEPRYAPRDSAVGGALLVTLALGLPLGLASGLLLVVRRRR